MSEGAIKTSSGLVYRNPKPYLRNLVAYHPSLIPLSELEFLATFDLGGASQAIDYHTVVARSTDRGETWTLEGPLLKEPPPSTSHTVRTNRLADGSLVGFGALFHRNEEEGLINRKTFGMVPVDLLI